MAATPSCLASQRSPLPALIRGRRTGSRASCAGRACAVTRFTYDDFMRKLDQIHPRFDRTLALPFPDQEEAKGL
jgi:hypothetical protein